jgi:hypothetical protein
VKHHIGRAAIACTIVAAQVLGVATSASGSTGQAAPTDEVLAIVSPLAAPACSALGSTTFLVPVVGGLATDQLAIEGLDVGDTLLDVLGPLFVVCGSLPGAQGTRCELDAQIAGIYPVELKALLPSPTILGGVVEGLNKLLETLGLPPDPLALSSVFKCAVPAGADAPVPPAAPGAPVVAPPMLSGFPAPLPPGSPSMLPLAEPAAPGTTTGAGTPARTSLISRVVRNVPGYFVTLQLILVTLLALYLGASWLTSARILRRRPRG